MSIRTLAPAVMAAAVLVGSVSGCSGKTDGADDRSSAASTVPPGPPAGEGCPSGSDDAGLDITRDGESSDAGGGDPGESRTLTLVASHPSGGAFAARSGIVTGYQAYFAARNAAGGMAIGGQNWSIVVKANNDDGRPARTAENLDTALGPDGLGAFGVLGIIGTANNAGVAGTLADKCVPNIFPVTSALVGGVEEPWSVGGPVISEATAAAAVVSHLVISSPGARIGVLASAGEDGDRIEDAYRAAVEGTSLSVVAAQRVPVGVDTDTSAEVELLAWSGADVMVDGVDLLSCPGAIEAARQVGWSPVVVAAGGCASAPLVGQAGDAAEGVLAAANLMDPSDPEFVDHPRVRRYRSEVETWAKDLDNPTASPDDPNVVLGWTMADLFTRAVASAGSVSRSALMTALSSLDVTDAGLAFEGIRFQATPTDPVVARQARVVRFDSVSATFSPVTPIVSTPTQPSGTSGPSGPGG